MTLAVLLLAASVLLFRWWISRAYKARQQRKLDQIRGVPYRAYTTEFDEIVRAGDVLSGIDQKFRLEAAAVIASRIAEMESSNNTAPLPEPLKSAISATAPSITFLVDHSGSMRGARALEVGASLITLVPELEQRGAKCEVLGFTTSSWRGGQSRTSWFTHDCPKLPGRLCDLRHIIYKSMSDSPEELQRNGALFAFAKIFKENVDGEALQWAAGRAESGNYPNWRCVVISDGAPVDDSTLTVNNSHLLEDHLIAVVRSLARGGVATISAIGIEHDVHRYYGVSCTAKPVDQFHNELVNLLGKVLAGSH